MPHQEEAFRKQKAVYLEANGADNYGKSKLDAAVELDVRWVAKQRQVITKEGKEVTSDVSVTLDQDVVVDGIMWLGELDDFDEDDTDDLFRVIAFDKTPDIKARVYKRTAYLVRFNDALPTLND